MEKWPGMAPNRAGRICFLLIQTLPTFWAERIWILRISMFFHVVDPKFLDFQALSFRLGSESSSGASGGGVWKSGDLEIQKLGIQHKKTKTNIKIQTVLPKMLAMSGLVGNKSSWPHLGPSQAIFSMAGKYKKHKIIKVRIRSAQNLRKVWISRKKTSRAPFGAIPGIFSMDRKQIQQMRMFCLFPPHTPPIVCVAHVVGR